MQRPFERLDAWKLSHRLALRLYQVTKQFPTEERYGLVAQIRRAGTSVSANIAEGSCAASKREFARYLQISLSSLNEVANWLILARDLGIVDNEEWQDLDTTIDRAGKVIWNLKRWLNTP